MSKEAGIEVVFLFSILVVGEVISGLERRREGFPLPLLFSTYVPSNTYCPRIPPSSLPFFHRRLSSICPKIPSCYPPLPSSIPPRSLRPSPFPVPFRSSPICLFQSHFCDPRLAVLSVPAYFQTVEGASSALRIGAKERHTPFSPLPGSCKPGVPRELNPFVLAPFLLCN